MALRITSIHLGQEREITVRAHEKVLALLQLLTLGSCYKATHSLLDNLILAEKIVNELLAPR